MTIKTLQVIFSQDVYLLSFLVGIFGTQFELGSYEFWPCSNRTFVF